MSSLYGQHITDLLQHYRTAMSKFNLDSIVISSGHHTHYFQDDIPHPFRAYSGAQQWLPFSLQANVHIIIPKHGLPTLLWPIQNDFWHASKIIPAGEWRLLWDIIDRPIQSDVTTYLMGKYVCFGPKKQQDIIEDPLSNKLHAFINYQKAYKTEFEIQAIAEANICAAKGHKAAEHAFLEGKSEFAIYNEYLTASEQTSSQEPYSGIVALNENAAILHYEKKQLQPFQQSRTLLIDAGVSTHGYASDITRTYTQDNGLFKDLLTSVETLQLQLCASATVGTDFQVLHDTALQGIAGILLQHKICSLSVEEQLQKDIPQTFFPHGLGHLLGLQVHDLGGHQRNREGDIKPSNPNSPYLRLTRTLEENMVITIEPGLYFIPMLLAKMQNEIPQHGCDFKKIETLLPFGGIRIEDNIVVGKEGNRNLTREAFSM